MNKLERATAIQQILWPTSGRIAWKVYVLLDAARREVIYPKVKECGLPFVCLYTGKLPQVLLEVAPYLVELRREAAFTRELLVERWEDSWGVLLLSSANLEELRRHFKRMLKVEEENGKVMLFRFYDPRVLRVYLPTCNARELSFVFGPVGMFVVPGEKGDVLPFYRRDDALLLADVPEVTGAATSPERGG